MSDDQLAQQSPGSEEMSLEVNGHSRWAIFERLQALGIECQCCSGQPLRVQVNSPHDLIQCWSVARHCDWRTGTKAQLQDWLEQCWAVEVVS